MIFLIEPYNAYQKPPRKKSLAEIAEEEALFYRIMLEQQRQIEESQKKQIEEQHRQIEEQRRQVIEQQKTLTERSALLQQQNLSLISQIPAPSSQQVQNAYTLTPASSGAAGIHRIPKEIIYWDTDYTLWNISGEIWDDTYYIYIYV